MRTTEDEGDTLETPSDDEEITIPYQEREDLRKVDIRGEQLENTQREDWLLPTEPRHGARPRQTPTSANFATAVEILAMKAFGDMGQTDVCLSHISKRLHSQHFYGCCKIRPTTANSGQIYIWSQHL